MRRRALMAAAGGGVGKYDGFPLYVTADEVEELIPNVGMAAYSYADYSELYNYLRDIIITKGEHGIFDDYYLSNPEDYGIDIYIDHYADGNFYRAYSLFLTTLDDFIELFHCDDDGWSGSALLYSDRIEWEFSK